MAKRTRKIRRADKPRTARVVQYIAQQQVPVSRRMVMLAFPDMNYGYVSAMLTRISRQVKTPLLDRHTRKWGDTWYTVNADGKEYLRRHRLRWKP